MVDDRSAAGSADYEQLHEVYGVHIRLAQYPILAPRIRELMRRELFEKGIITAQAFEAEVRQKAVLSQHREGLADPFGQESEPTWNARLAVIRDQLTDFYFAYNFPPDRLNDAIQRTLTETTSPEEHALILSFNPELAPMDLLFSQGLAYEALPPEQLSQVRHHLREIIVVLIKSMLSDQLEFVGIAKEIFSVRDLQEVRKHLIGRGKIGGKAAGLLLAQKILQDAASENAAEHALELHRHVEIPDSYYIGADVFYEFQMVNGFTRYMNQKYRTASEIQTDYPGIRQAYVEGHFPPEIILSLRRLLEEVGNVPLIVRSSSLLEVHFGAALAGKYESVFCPNQGTAQENLDALLRAVSKVYASTLSPDALLYRQRMGLVDYDERMAVLIQKVVGTRYRHYLFPAIAGVGYSRNPFRWNPKIRRDDGFLRLVAGFGTRAVERVANDFPRIVALSHPELRPHVGSDRLRKYAQRYIDLLDLEDGQLKTLPAKEVIQADYPGIRYLASLDKGDYIAPIIARLPRNENGRLLLTFDQLLKDAEFIGLMRSILEKLERFHNWSVDIEFTVEIGQGYPDTDYTIHLLQCRPQISHKERLVVDIPDTIAASDLILQTTELVPHGAVAGIRYIVYVRPDRYHHAPSYELKLDIARVIGRLNMRLANTNFILIGPGRWGSSDVDLGVKVTYADIHNTRVLVEVSSAAEGTEAEPSYGTHFFQDLVEAGIYPLPITLNNRGAVLNTKFLDGAPNVLTDLVPEMAAYSPYVQVIDIPAVAQGRTLQIIMNDELERAVGYLSTSRAAEQR